MRCTKGRRIIWSRARWAVRLLVRAMRYAIERVRLAEQLASYAEELRERNAQMEADFTMAREIQQVFLPQQYPTFPRSVSTAQSALRFHHRYLPAAAVGGRFLQRLCPHGYDRGRLHLRRHGPWHEGRPGHRHHARAWWRS